MKVMVVGGEDFTERAYPAVKAALDAIGADELVMGGLGGAAGLARRWAGENGVTAMTGWVTLDPLDVVLVFPGAKLESGWVAELGRSGVTVLEWEAPDSLRDRMLRPGSDIEAEFKENLKRLLGALPSGPDEFIYWGCKKWIEPIPLPMLPLENRVRKALDKAAKRGERG